MSGTVHTATDQIKSTVPHPYHLVTPSIWPLFGGMSALLVFTGIIFAAHFDNFIFLAIGLLSTFTIMFLWWRDVVRESQVPGLHKIVTQVGLRYGMALFISSEVMFFVSFFWNYFNYFFYPSAMGVAYAPVWPPMGLHTIDPFAIPLFNTMDLLLSGTTITWAHHCLLEGDNKGNGAGAGGYRAARNCVPLRSGLGIYPFAISVLSRWHFRFVVLYRNRVSWRACDHWDGVSGGVPVPRDGTSV